MATAERPLFLITNDDGIHAPGLQVLEKAARELGDVLVVAPSEERSGASQSITLMRPFRAHKKDETHYAIEGTPVDCVLFALRSFPHRRIDWVLSGINRGPNLGDDTLYSGTVGGAMTGCISGLSAMAVSLAEFAEVMHYETAGKVVKRLLENRHLFPKDAVVNVNVPNLLYSELKGFAISELSRRHYDETFHVEEDMLNQTLCWYGKGRAGHDGIRGRDCSDVDAGNVAISLLEPSLFAREKTDKLRAQWMLKL